MLLSNSSERFKSLGTHSTIPSSKRKDEGDDLPENQSSSSKKLCIPNIGIDIVKESGNILEEELAPKSSTWFFKEEFTLLCLMLLVFFLQSLDFSNLFCIWAFRIFHNLVSNKFTRYFEHNFIFLLLHIHLPGRPNVTISCLF